MDRYPYILGCLLGTAVGDALGLAREGLSRGRGTRMFGQAAPIPSLALGYGFCSDDTEHAQMTARAWVLSKGDPQRFSDELGQQFKKWLVTLPAGIGLATLKSCLKLLVGYRPMNSGVNSAGNGPAMRSAILGVVAESDQQMEELVARCTRITHTDSKALDGALVVARAARLAVGGEPLSAAEFVERSISQTHGEELRACLTEAMVSLRAGHTPREFADAQGWTRGVSGYMNQTVPAAIYCWARYPDDFRKCVEEAVLLGGDADTVAAITGSICGANLGYQQIPDDWLSRIVFWPRDVQWHRQLAQACEQIDGEVPGMRWLATIPRNLLFAAIVHAIGFRRLLPPY